MIREYLK